MRRLVLLMMLFGPGVPGAGAFEFIPGVRYDPAVPTLQQVLGHAPGERITDAAGTRRYLQALATARPAQVRLYDYGTTWERRALFYAVIGSPENIAALGDFERAMQALADPAGIDDERAEALIASTPGSVWLAYSVHGDEISSTDAALSAAYHLLAATGDEVVAEILERTLVFINPLQNPDGRDRFIGHFEQALGLEPRPERAAAEHDEPWPTGRVNHYLFDLNRDWLALTQPETVGHVAALRKWYPLVFVDLHEMGPDSSYFFAPDAVPYNPHLAPAQRANLELFGRNNARWFDRFGIDYFTREVYDAFYPGYGASWPAYYGAIAMTYEQASVGGLVIRRADGAELSYRESVRHHFLTSLATAQTVARNREKLLRDFYQYRKSASAADRRGPREYLLDAGPDPSAADKLAGILTRQGVAVRRAQAPFSACGTDYPAGSYAIALAQPAGRLIRTLLDPQVDMEEGFVAEQERRRAKDLEDEIYDVTAWSLPLMFNVPLGTCDRPVGGGFEPASDALLRPGRVVGAGAEVAYLVPWGTLAAGRLLARALSGGIEVRSSDRAFTHGGRRYPAGTLILKADSDPELGAKLATLARETGAEVVGVNDSWVEDGPSFGSENVVELIAPEIALAWDEPTGSYAAGNTRFVLERQFGYPVTPIRTRTLAEADLTRFDVLILPESNGDYAAILGTAGAENLKRWVAAGGTLIALGNAVGYAAHPAVDLISIRREDAYRETKPEKPDDAAEPPATVAGTVLADDAAYRAALVPDSEPPDPVAGVLVRAVVDRDHWLGAGAAERVNVLLKGEDLYTPIRLDRGANVARFAAADELLASGYLWEENRRQTAYKPFAVVQPEKSGGIVIAFTEDPNFRAYLDGLNVLFLNAVFRGPAHVTKHR